MISDKPKAISAAKCVLSHSAVMSIDGPLYTPRASQTIPDWAIDHLGKKVRFIRPYVEGNHTWSPKQVGTLEALQVGENGVECVVYFDDYDGDSYLFVDDYDDHSYVFAPAKLLMPIYDSSISKSAGNNFTEPSVIKTHSNLSILEWVSKLLFRTKTDATMVQKSSGQ